MMLLVMHTLFLIARTWISLMVAQLDGMLTRDLVYHRSSFFFWVFKQKKKLFSSSGVGHRLNIGDGESEAILEKHRIVVRHLDSGNLHQQHGTNFFFFWRLYKTGKGDGMMADLLNRSSTCKPRSVLPSGRD